ncbi:UDP-glycosyltransferase 86A1-like [Musa acuminata AAA Group]|uniref:UDP-glycosyltransferase 86A1 n=1 Tax=Musa acuminata AAA Group TaxID=214697 RepID=UPI0031D8E2C3
MAASHRKPPHALLVPYPLQGHIIPAVHLAIKLASRGFAITFVNTEAVHHQTCCAARRSGSDLGHDIFPAARASGLDIRYELVSDGLPVAFDRSLNHDQFMFAVLHVLSAHVEELIRKLSLRADPPLTCLIADTFFVWPSTLAKKFGIPYVSFWTEPALIFSLYYHMDLLIRNGHFASHDNSKDTITYVPGVAAIEPADLMSYLQETDVSTVVHQIIFKAFDEAKAADFVLCNTVQELESDTISALQREKPFYAVGPIFPAGFTRSAVATSLWAESDCSQWLDSKPPGSVLYISFGSYAHIGRRDLEEIAHGVLGSTVSFIWVLRSDVVSSDEPDPLPEDFAEESQGRGVVVPWCCQVELLKHRSIGGFLTHCGWNSILESIWCGVPLLCFPLLTDQFTNRKLVVNDWRIGLDLGRTNKVNREEVSKRIEILMEGEAGNEARKNIREVRRALEIALTPEGSSHKNLDQFIADLTKYGEQINGV